MSSRNNLNNTDVGDGALVVIGALPILFLAIWKLCELLSLIPYRDWICK